MADLGKVLKGLECCGKAQFLTYENCKNCPYIGGDCMQMFKDAIDLLKEREPVKPNISFPMPKSGRRHGFCGNCGAGLRIAAGSRDDYCWRCGRKVKWE